MRRRTWGVGCWSPGGWERTGVTRLGDGCAGSQQSWASPVSRCLQPSPGYHSQPLSVNLCMTRPASCQYQAINILIKYKHKQWPSTVVLQPQKLRCNASQQFIEMDLSLNLRTVFHPQFGYLGKNGQILLDKALLILQRNY